MGKKFEPFLVASIKMHLLLKIDVIKRVRERGEDAKNREIRLRESIARVVVTTRTCHCGFNSIKLL